MLAVCPFSNPVDSYDSYKCTNGQCFCRLDKELCRSAKKHSLETLAAYSFCKLAIVQIDKIIVNPNNCENCVDPKMHLSRDPCCTTTVCAVVDSYTTPTNEDYHSRTRRKKCRLAKCFLLEKLRNFAACLTSAS